MQKPSTFRGSLPFPIGRQASCIPNSQPVLICKTVKNRKHSTCDLRCRLQEPVLAPHHVTKAGSSADVSDASNWDVHNDTRLSVGIPACVCGRGFFERSFRAYLGVLLQEPHIQTAAWFFHREKVEVSILAGALPDWKLEGVLQARH